MPPPPLASANNDQAMANCCASAITEARLTPAQQLQLMHLIRDYIEIEVRKKVVYFTPHPHGVGFFQLGDPCQRDTLVATSSHWIGGHEVCFVRHDETAINVRNSPYTRKSDDDADPTAHNGSPHSLEGLVVPGDTHLSDEAQDENGILTTLLNPSVGLRDQDPAVTVHAASSSVATAMLRDIDKQAVEENNLVEQAVIQHNKVPTIDSPTLSAMNNRVTTNQDEHVRREAIFSLLAAGLRQILHGQITLPFTGSLGSVLIPSPLIQIDLASLEIDSFNISVNYNGQCTATTAAVSPVPTTSMVMIQIPEVKKALTSLPAQPADLLIKKTPVTRVYYRRKFKDKTKEFERETMVLEPSLEQDGSIYAPDHTVDNDSKNKGKRKVIRKTKCSTPTSTQMLRRSPRFTAKLDGYKPVMAASKKKEVGRKKTENKVKPQADLLDTILLPPTSQAIEFPGLSTVEEYVNTHTVFPEIPITEIQKVATELCCIDPVEVTAELLLAPRPEDAGPSRSGP